MTAGVPGGEGTLEAGEGRVLERVHCHVMNCLRLLTPASPPPKTPSPAHSVPIPILPSNLLTKKVPMTSTLLRPGVKS